MSLVAFKKGKKKVLNKIEADSNVEDFEIMSRLKDNNISFKLPRATRNKLLKLEDSFLNRKEEDTGNDDNIFLKTDSKVSEKHEIRALQIELKKLKKTMKVFKVFWSFAGDLTVLSS